MNIALEGGMLVIRASRLFLAQLRELPDRYWSPELEAWVASYMVENYDYMVARGWPLDGIDRPTASSLRLELASYRGEVYFALYVPQGHEWVERCRLIPESRMWSAKAKCWLCKPTLRNATYIKQTFAAANYSEAATSRMLSVLAEAEKLQEEADAAKVLQRQLTATPDITDFKFKTKPYDHQVRAFALSRDRTAFALFMEQGTGKTKVAIDTAAWLRSRNEIDAMLIICPNDVKDVWPEELAVHMVDWVDYVTMVDGRVKRAEVDAFATIERDFKPMKILVTNVESMASKDRFEIAHRFVAGHRTLVIVDESTRFKNPSAKRTKALLKLGRDAKYRRIMTGTPMTQTPLDLYAPCKFLSPSILGFHSFISMVKHHGIMGGFQGKQVVGFKNVEEIKAKIDPHSFRVLRDDCLDLPPKVFKKHYVDLTGEQRRIYDDLRDELVAELTSGGKISAAHSLVKIVRLAQITGGFVKPDEMPIDTVDFDDTSWNARVAHNLSFAVQRIPGDNPKLETTLDIISRLKPTDKVIIWARFRAEIELIQAELAAAYGEDSVVTFYGGVKRDERTERRHRFQGTPDQPHDPTCRFFVAQVDTGSVGLTLTRAQTVIYYSNSFSLETRLQSEDRTHRIGQTGTVTYHDLVARDTLDVPLIGALKRKKKFADQITGDSWKEWL